MYLPAVPGPLCVLGAAVWVGGCSVSVRLDADRGVRQNIPPIRRWANALERGFVVGSDRTIHGRLRRSSGYRIRQWAPRRTFKLTVLCPRSCVVCWFHPRWGYVPHSLTVYRQDGERTFLMPRLELRAVKRVSLKRGTAADVPVHVAAVESNVFAKLGALVAHCCVTRYDDGEPRQPGWFTIKTYGSSWVVQVKDPDAAASLSCTAASLDDALALADLMLSSPDAPWEPDRFLKAKDGSRKK